MTRARKKVFIFCWEDNHSEFLPPKLSLTDLINLYKQENCWKAIIIRSTEKAVLLQIQVYFNECLEVWIPKYQIYSRYDPNSTQIQIIQVDYNWILSELHLSSSSSQSPYQHFEQASTLPAPEPERSTKSPLIQGLEKGYVKARILKSTERALLLMFPINYDEYITEWIPKSVITNPYSAGSKELQQFYIKTYWLEKKLS